MSVHDMRIEELKTICGGQLSDLELDYLLRTKDIFDEILLQRQGFDFAIRLVEEPLSELTRRHFDDDADGSFSSELFDVDSEPIVRGLSLAEQPMTDDEIGFIRDAIGAIDFVIRNGIGFPVIAGALSHDIHEILRHGSLAKALAAPFRPKVQGYADVTEESFGDSEESCD